MSYNQIGEFGVACVGPFLWTQEKKVLSQVGSGKKGRRSQNYGSFV